MYKYYCTARNAAGGGRKPAIMQSEDIKEAKTMYYCFRLRGNVPPFTSDGTEALEEHFNAGDYTPEEIESELNRLNINGVFVYQEE